MVNITLQGQEYSARLDFATIGKIQTELSKVGLTLKLKQIFEEIEKENFAVVTEVVVQSILRCHPKLKRHHIEDKLDLDELVNALTFVAELVQNSISMNEGKSKEETIPQ